MHLRGGPEATGNLLLTNCTLQSLPPPAGDSANEDEVYCLLFVCILRVLFNDKLFAFLKINKDIKRLIYSFYKLNSGK